MSVRIKTEKPDVVQSFGAASPLTADAPLSSAAIGDDGHGDEDDTTIAREIDVFLSPTLAQQMYLLQYPLQHTEVGDLSAARIKPRHAQLELEQPLPELPQRYYQVGEQNMSVVQSRIFESLTIPVDTHMCLAKLLKDDNGESQLHLIPLKHVHQMRPSLQHIDIEDKKNEKIDEPDLEKKEEEGNKALEKKPLLFKRRESERAAMLRKTSYAYKRSSEEAEEWQELQICPEDSPQHGEILGLVPCKKRNQPVLAKPKEGKEQEEVNQLYIESLNYMPTSDMDPQVAFAGSNDMKSIIARLVALLREGWPIPFSVIEYRFGGVDFEILFRGLSVCALMVRGNFCLQSKFLALPKSLQSVRTFILLVIQTNGFVQRKKLIAAFEDQREISEEKISTLLIQVAKLSPSHRGWVLRIEDDLFFAAKHPHQAELYETFWDRQKKTDEFARLLRRYNAAIP